VLSYSAEPDFQIEYQIRFEESKQKWHPHSIYNRRTKHASYFNNEIAAANSSGSAPQKYHGEFTVLYFKA